VGPYNRAGPRRLLILGSPGSIGTQALDTVSRSPEAIALIGLSAESSWAELVTDPARLAIGGAGLGGIGRVLGRAQTPGDREPRGGPRPSVPARRRAGAPS
jgi:hypothetical protein